MKIKILAFVIIMLLTVYITTGVYAQQTIDGFEAPESIVKYGNKLFVSNIGGTAPNPLALDSNGFISELSIDGKIIEKKFQKTLLNGPKGLAIIKNVLYVADINRIVGLDNNSGAQVFELNIPGSGLLNDLCAIDDTALVVSESIYNKIFRVNIASKSYTFLGSVAGANGVTYDANTKKLFVCGMGEQMNGKGKLYVKDAHTKDTVFLELPNSPTGVFDGLEMMDNDHLLVTDWVGLQNNTKARFVIYGIKDHSTKIYAAEPGPADLCYDKVSHTVYLPQMLRNSILVENIATLKQK